MCPCVAFELHLSGHHAAGVRGRILPLGAADGELGRRLIRCVEGESAPHGSVRLWGALRVKIKFKLVLLELELNLLIMSNLNLTFAELDHDQVQKCKSKFKFKFDYYY